MRFSMPQIEPINIEKHYSPAFFAELWGVSPDTVVRMFQDVEGVLKLGNPKRPGRRSRVELRIPYALAVNVYRERCK